MNEEVFGREELNQPIDSERLKNLFGKERKEEKDKYSAFIAEVSEILGLGKPVDIIKLCMTTDRFFKPYQMRVAELEKELEETKLQNAICEEALKKENAELKETLRTYNGCGDWDNDFHTCRVYLQHEELQEYMHQLNRAIELIENIIRVTWGEGWNYDFDWKVKAEQFLSEVKK